MSFPCPQRVEMASEFAVSEVFSHKKPKLGVSSIAVPLQSTEQLRDHDEAYSEGRFPFTKNNNGLSL